MKTVGQILSEKRQELGLSLMDVEKETKIRQKYLEAIEKNEFAQISETVSAEGFVRNYAQVLGLPTEKVLAIFRRDFDTKAKAEILPKGINPQNNPKFYWTPKLTAGLIIVLLLFLGVFLGLRQYLSFSGAPPLEVFSPVEGQSIKGIVEVAGRTDKDATVRIDGVPILVSEDGSFKEETVLPKGENVILIEATSRQGKKRIINRKVKVE